MTYADIMKELEGKIKDRRKIVDWRPCEELYGVPTILGAIVAWLNDGSKIIYIPKENNSKKKKK